MKNFFEPSFFKGNRKRLLEKSDAKLIVIAANTTMQRSGDTSYPFRQDSSFWYLTGIDEPDYVLVISKEETYLIAPQLSKYQKIMETQAARTSLQETSGIKEVLSSLAGWTKLQKQLKGSKKVGVLMPANTKRYYAIAPNPARAHLLRRLKRYANATKITDIKKYLVDLRMIKQPAEIDALQTAIDITADTIKEIFTKDWYKHYDHEYEIEAALHSGFRKRGASGHAFTPIVISGNKTSVIHNFSSDDPLQAGEMIQIDVGAEVSNYGADISRVIAIGEQFTPRQQEILDAVKEVQDYAYSLLKPGVTVRENEKKIEEYMGKVLKRLGLISSENPKSIRARYPHACSHLLGLDTHDAADYTQPLKPGMVLTVEPGIYIPEEGLGVRIEDDVIITLEGDAIGAQHQSRKPEAKTADKPSD